MARKAFWKPYCDGVQTNDGHSVIKSINLLSIPEFIRSIYDEKETDNGQEIIQRIEGRGKNYSKKGKLESEFDVIKVLSGEGNSGIYNKELIKKVEKNNSKMYLPHKSAPILIINKDGSCGIVACCLPDVFEVI